MTDPKQPKVGHTKTPDQVSEFEREQLSFLLSGDDISSQLSEINPSLTWLPVLSQMKLVQNETQVFAWIERNLDSVDTVREVVANLRFFGADTASFLEQRLNRKAATLPPLIAKSWQLLTRHMRRTATFSEWFDIAPQLNRGDHSLPLLERLSRTLRPELTISKRFSPPEHAIERPSDLMTIDFEVPEGISPNDVLAAWPENANAKDDKDLLNQLTTSLDAALAEAIDAGVERDGSWSVSDFDVPSVADHPQNEYRSGFLVIVRVMADIWSRLAAKSATDALDVARLWRESTFRLVRRLALFAFANRNLPAEQAADLLTVLPANELFMSSSTVEVFRLIRARWTEFPLEKQEKILERVRNGPPHDLFREGVEIDRAIDRYRFDILASMEREKFDIGAKSTALLNEIRARWPNWLERPSEQAGFHIWHGDDTLEAEVDSKTLAGIPDSQLVSETRKLDAAAIFSDSNVWQDLCAADPDRALRGLRAAASHDDWPLKYWERLLWSRTAYTALDTEEVIAQLLVNWPSETFAEVVDATSSWLTDHAKSLSPKLLWPLWDRLLDASLIDRQENQDA